jgi:hypothetical protein
MNTPRQGFHVIGALHQRTGKQLIARYQKEGCAVSMLIDKTFGNSMARLPIIMEKPSLIIATLVNCAGLRNQRLQSYEFAYGHSVRSFDEAVIRKDSKLLSPIKERLKNFKKLVPAGKELYISFGLEHDLSEAGAKSARDWLLDQGYKVVDNPLSRNYNRLSNAKDETHGHNKTDMAVYSHDGLDASDAQYYGKKPYQGQASLAELYWILPFNLNISGVDEWYVARSRKTACTEYELRYVNQLMKPTPAAPRISGYKVLAAPNIFKPCSEDYRRENDDRQGLPVIIIQGKYSSVTLKTLEGKKICSVPYYGPYKGGGHRYYPGQVDQTHFTLFDANDKREWILMDAGNEKFLVNIFRRLGVQRP